MAERLGLHPTDLQCVSLLGLEPGLHTTGVIANLTGLASEAATRLVDRLEKAGLVERRPDSHDRRKTLVRLTTAPAPHIEAARDAPGRAPTVLWTTARKPNSPWSSGICGASPKSATNRPHACGRADEAPHRLHRRTSGSGCAGRRHGASRPTVGRALYVRSRSVCTRWWSEYGVARTPCSTGAMPRRKT
ncbi:MarR family winged helix-turn-helix transcriptional regulator [Streptomyces afghaniensis]|uniref:MarR family winged helix-turn-helix transcriptional regulator n=1 Tax=Streptomyces afghaniensis TaxID=66865 RepID=UPI0027D82820|nr:MarR family transcriptional regulator [Streptomyces afghaniensis]